MDSRRIHQELQLDNCLINESFASSSLSWQLIKFRKAIFLQLHSTLNNFLCVGDPNIEWATKKKSSMFHIWSKSKASRPKHRDSLTFKTEPSFGEKIFPRFRKTFPKCFSFPNDNKSVRFSVMTFCYFQDIHESIFWSPTGCCQSNSSISCTPKLKKKVSRAKLICLYPWRSSPWL